ncbi:sugar/nucleoside kinase (ribokinase family) [Nocardioides thalensis]|uniref:Sugar/nucleoside kinase (Ribokinase family) n=1 Tax=Nocardioides thalensis TaxID=1914755 RepID=A0A853BVT2_9ACTN|nr:M15 family metallopeptidase [Nocardioides thalensis]NYI99388.1 sugar/nucleoside kinase (ribokinase family) [Nocardioides thalensis]
MSKTPAFPLVLAAVVALTAGCSESTSDDPGSNGSTGLTRAARGSTPAPHLPGDVFDESQPTIANLDPELLDAVQAAAEDARADGVHLVITSGWRSREHQQRLFDEAVAEHGSEEEALRYVSTPDTSAHVTGDAVDIGPKEADEWLIEHGAAYGLCQIFANEIWHFELATTPGEECPPMYPDSSYRG